MPTSDPQPSPSTADPDRLERKARTARRAGWALAVVLLTGVALSLGAIFAAGAGESGLMVLASALTSTGTLGVAVAWGLASSWRRSARQERWFHDRFGGSVTAARRSLDLAAVAGAGKAGGEIGAVREIRRQLPEVSLPTALRIATSD